MWFKIFLVGVFHFVTSQRKSLNVKLIDKCNLPWKDYHVTGLNLGFFEVNRCHKKCTGYAFYTNESKLICFKDKFQAEPLPMRYIEDRDDDLCYCGFRKIATSSVVEKGKKGMKTVPDWQKCHPIRRRKYGEHKYERRCKVECSGLAVYIYKRGSKKFLLHCEEYKRTNFHKVVGSTGSLQLTSHPLGEVKNSRLCTCGIENKDVVKLNEIISLTSTDMLKESFKECSTPWPSPRVRGNSMDSCLNYCNTRCRRGKGIHHNGDPVCFHQEYETKMKAARTKMADGGCECGHVKKNIREKSSRTFVSCDPKITSSTPSRNGCIKFCAESRVYVTIFPHQPSKIYCIHKPDVEKLKPQYLTGKCEKKINENEGNSQQEYTLTCRCGLGISLKTNNTENKLRSANESKNKNTELEIPPSWATRKKRSVVNRDKKSFKAM